MTDIQPGKLNPLKKPKGTESKGNKPVRIFGRNHLKCVVSLRMELSQNFQIYLMLIPCLTITLIII